MNTMDFYKLTEGGLNHNHNHNYDIENNHTHQLYMEHLVDLQIMVNSFSKDEDSFVIVDTYETKSVNIKKVRTWVSGSILFHIIYEHQHGTTDFVRSYDSSLKAIDVYELFILNEVL